MNKHFPKKAKDIKGAVAIAELRRAHGIIALLAVTLAILIGVGSLYSLRFDSPLAIVVVGLLCLVSALSLATVIALLKPSK